MPDGMKVEYNEKTGRYCVGIDCFKTGIEPRLDGKGKEVFLEYNPNAKCPLKVKKFIMALHDAMVEGGTRMKVRKKIHVE